MSTELRDNPIDERRAGELASDLNRITGIAARQALLNDFNDEPGNFLVELERLADELGVGRG
jgi:hypothetical protein